MPDSKQTLYRPDIDGLRALAVLSVIFFHFDYSFVSGGFVGVDIFFVISGYLITRNIQSDINAGSFSISSFWIKRARRILPASLFMMLVVLIVFAFIYPTSFYKDIAASALAQSFFSSNILFWKQSGYFSTAAELKPLLHTWSLSIEEQFYLLLPWFLIISFKYTRKYTVLLLGAACLVSLFLSIYFAKSSPIPAFYLLPSRAWELGMGSMLALLTMHGQVVSKSIRELAAIAGLVLLVGSILLFDSNTPFPSYHALAPVVGTTLLIWAHHSGPSTISKCLEFPLVVRIGLISYSLYLWHWPVIVFSKWYFVDESETLIRLTALFATLVLSLLSYKYVETPVRRRRLVFTDKRVAIGALLSSASIVIISVVVFTTGNSRIVDSDGAINAYYTEARSAEANRGDCIDRVRKQKSTVSCKYNYSTTAEKTDIFIWGDSHASSIVPAFDLVAKQNLWNLEFSATTGCQSVVGMHRVDYSQQCEETNLAVAEHIQKSKFPIVILVSSFVNNVSKGKLRDINSDTNIDSEKASAEFAIRFKETISLIQNSGSLAVVYTEEPRLDRDPVLHNLNRMLVGKEPIQSELTIDDHLERISSTYEMMDNSGIDFRMDYSPFFCPNRCKTSELGKSLYKDISHISNYGAASVSPLIEADLKMLFQQSK